MVRRKRYIYEDIFQMKKAILFFILLSGPVCLLGQGVSIGKTQEQIRSMVQSNTAFKLKAGENTDTLVFQDVMSTVFFYKDKICNRTVSLMSLKAMDYMVRKMTEDGYTKTAKNIWLSTHKTLRVEISVDEEKSQCTVETTAYNEISPKNQ